MCTVRGSSLLIFSLEVENNKQASDKNELAINLLSYKTLVPEPTPKHTKTLTSLL